MSGAYVGRYYGKTNHHITEPTKRTRALGEAVFYIRRKQELTQAALAAKTIFSPSTISRIERNEHGLTDDGYTTIAKALGCTFDELQHKAGLLQEKPEPKPEPKPEEKLPNGLTAAQTWAMSVNTLKVKGKHNALVEAMGRYGSFVEYKDGTFIYGVNEGPSALAMVAYLNNAKNIEPLVCLLGAQSKRAVKFRAEIRKVQPAEKPTEAPMEKVVKYTPAPAPAPVKIPVARFGPGTVAPVQNPVQEAPKPAVPAPAPRPSMTAGAERMLTAEERKYLVEMIGKCLQTQMQRSLETGKLPDAERFAMLVHIKEVLEK